MYLWPSYEEQFGSHTGPSTRGDLGANIPDSASSKMEAIRKRALVGDSDGCVTQLREYERTTGTDHVIVRLSFPGMDQLELLCTEVVPAVD